MLNILIWAITALATAGVIIRPFRIAEALWAVSGAVLLIITGLLSFTDAWKGVVSGTDVYLFLAGMMLLAELARTEKLFGWLAAHAAKQAKGDAGRLFVMVYAVGIVVTIFLSNDATAVVLTPAVAAVMRTAKIKNPIPYLLICAFIANAASFVLPISNPANLVIYGTRMPALLPWLQQYCLPSLVSVCCTFLLLRYTQRKSLTEKFSAGITIPALTPGGKMAAAGILFTALVLLIASAWRAPLGFCAALCGMITVAIALWQKPVLAWPVFKGISWSVLPLVAGLFVMVEALNKTGLIQLLQQILQQHASTSITKTAWGAGLLTAYLSNLTNNLPAGLIAGNTLKGLPVPEVVRSAVLIGIDLGPNLSITGSLATILWLVALRREGLQVTAWSFLKLGMLIMTVTLLATLGSLWI